MRVHLVFSLINEGKLGWLSLHFKFTLTEFQKIWYGRYVIRQENKRTKITKEFWEELVSCCPVVRHGPYEKQNKIK
jgi:hypothetical protein